MFEHLIAELTSQPRVFEATFWTYAGVFTFDCTDMYSTGHVWGN